MPQGEGTTWHLERWGVSMKLQGTTAIGTGVQRKVERRCSLRDSGSPVGRAHLARQPFQLDLMSSGQWCSGF